MKAVKFEVEGFDSLVRTVVKGGSSARINVPLSWRGRKVFIIATDEPAVKKE